MTDVVSSHNLLPFPVNTTKTTGGADRAEELEQWLKPYKAGEKGKAEAQKVVDWLDEVNPELSHREIS